MDITYLPADAISVWIPFTTSPFFLEDYYGNHLLYPSAKPTTAQFKLLSHAILRAQIRQLAVKGQNEADVSQGQRVIGTYLSITPEGIFLMPDLLAAVAQPSEAVLIALDGVEPATTYCYRKIGDTDSLVAMALCLEGADLADAATAETMTIQFADAKKAIITVPLGLVTWLAAPAGTEAIVEYDFHKAEINGKKSGTLNVVFGEAGVVIDGRGRPFMPPQDTPTDKIKLKQWIDAAQKPVSVMTLTTITTESP